MPRPLALSLALAAGALSGASLMTACAQPTLSAPATAHDGTLLSISASAEAGSTPDIASLSTGVVTQAADANAALRTNAAQMTAVVAAIKAAGIAERDIRTSGISLHPQYRYAEHQPPVITGYQASNNVTIKVRDVARLGNVLDAMVASGANQIDGPSFGIDQPDALHDQARRAALEKAQARARMYAESLGLRVRRVVSISEGGGFQAPAPVMMRAMAMDKAASTPVAPGETTITASLDVVFELGK